MNAIAVSALTVRDGFRRRKSSEQSLVRIVIGTALVIGAFWGCRDVQVARS